MALFLLIIGAIVLIFPAVFCLFVGGVISALGAMALLVWGYLFGIGLMEYIHWKREKDEEEST